MPPKRTASTSKRKASSPLSDDDVSKTAKKSKVSAATSAARYSDQPTNKVLPVNISFPQKVPDTLRFATWNIAGLAASHKKGFKYYVEAEEPDILVLTETKVRAITRFWRVNLTRCQVNNVPVDPVLTERFPYAHWTISDKKTYGTCYMTTYTSTTIKLGQVARQYCPN